VSLNTSVEKREWIVEEGQWPRHILEKARFFNYTVKVKVSLSTPWKHIGK
jgi:hypothetical protein